MVRKILGITLFAFAAPVLAGDLSYNFVELGYQRVELDDDGAGFNLDGDGFGISGSFEVGDSWFIAAGYGQTGFDYGIDLDQLSVGFGYHAGISDRADVFAVLSYVRAEASLSGFGSESDDGFGASVGVRGFVSDSVELAGMISYVDLGDGGDGTSVGGEALYYFTERFAVGLNVEVEEDAMAYGVGARFYFGN
ncbi:MAG: porin [Woeseiaceae bacterium]|jgi:hypothetical protein